MYQDLDTFKLHLMQNAEQNEGYEYKLRILIV